jgi:DNA-binding NarL/FixJ family response regulator
MPSPHIALIEDETVFRQLLKRALQKNKGWENVADFSDGREGLNYCLRTPPELLLVDLHLPGKHGLDIIREVRRHSPSTRILVLTGHVDGKLPGQLMAMGVGGYVDKTAPLNYVMQAIDSVMGGGMYFAAHVPPDPTAISPAALTPASEAKPSVLSERELEVARLVAGGLSSKEIAAKLNLSARTVEKHRANIMDKIGVREVASLVRWCLQNGVV